LEVLELEKFSQFFFFGRISPEALDFLDFLATHSISMLSEKVRSDLI